MDPDLPPNRETPGQGSPVGLYPPPPPSSTPGWGTSPPPPGWAPPPTPGWASLPPPADSSLTVLAWIFAFLFWPVGLVLALVARSKGLRARGPLIASIAVGVVSIAGVVTAVIVALPTFARVERATCGCSWGKALHGSNLQIDPRLVTPSYLADRPCGCGNPVHLVWDGPESYGGFYILRAPVGGSFGNAVVTTVPYGNGAAVGYSPEIPGHTYTFYLVESPQAGSLVVSPPAELTLTVPPQSSTVPS